MATTIKNALEAVRFMEEALDAMDQANHCLKLAKMEAQAGGFRRPTNRDLYNDLESMLDEFKRITCDDCGNPIFDASIRGSRGEEMSVCRCNWRNEPTGVPPARPDTSAAAAGRFAVVDLSEAQTTGESEIISTHNTVEDARAALAAHPHRADCLIFDRFTLQEVK